MCYILKYILDICVYVCLYILVCKLSLDQVFGTEYDHYLDFDLRL